MSKHSRFCRWYTHVFGRLAISPYIHRQHPINSPSFRWSRRSFLVKDASESWGATISPNHPKSSKSVDHFNIHILRSPEEIWQLTGFVFFTFFFVFYCFYFFLKRTSRNVSTKYIQICHCRSNWGCWLSTDRSPGSLSRARFGCSGASLRITGGGKIRGRIEAANDFFMGKKITYYNHGKANCNP